MLVAENKKKRKRTPLAKDWPPTSGQKKTLVPYGKRSWKLPRLDGAPYKDVWMKIVSLALVDLQGYKACCQKMKYFREVHRELRSAIITIIESPVCEPFKIKIRDSRYAIKYPSLRIFRGDTPGSGFDLSWTPDEEDVNIEKLIWINLTTGVHRKITHFSVGTRPCDIVRFIRASDWETFICEYIHGRIENHIRLSMYWHGKYNVIGSNTLKYLIWMAPKWIDRSKAQRIVGKLVSRNPRMDQETSSREKIFPYLFS